MSAEELLASALSGKMPAGLPPEARALWLMKAGDWDAAHEVAQDIHTETGSWIHGLLHFVEGDIGNARYWYARAGRQSSFPADSEAEWTKIARSLCG